MSTLGTPKTMPFETQIAELEAFKREFERYTLACRIRVRVKPFDNAAGSSEQGYIRLTTLEDRGYAVTVDTPGWYAESDDDPDKTARASTGQELLAQISRLFVDRWATDLRDHLDALHAQQRGYDDGESY